MEIDDSFAVTHGHLYGRFKPNQLAALLGQNGLEVDSNEFCVRVRGMSHFKLEVFDGVVSLDADEDTVEQMTKDASTVSAALARAQVRHRFEVYGPDDTMCAEFYHE